MAATFRKKSSAASTAKPTATPRAAKHSTKKPAVQSKAGTATLVSSKLSFKGRVFNVFTETLQEPSGHRHIKDVVRHNGSVVMLAVDDRANPADPDIILERQYRHAAGQYLIELPAGSLNPGEPPLAGAKRELIEETGFRAHRWTLLLRYFASPGFLGEWMQIYLARDIREGVATPELDEQIEIIRMPLSKIMSMIDDGKVHDGKTIVGLCLYDRLRREGRL
ncbi:MAG: NUDIX hydrolase [Acidobacteriota bacterium]|nr:NUDIX hydrolase [Acidobacteriota bacterium]